MFMTSTTHLVRTGPHPIEGLQPVFYDEHIILTSEQAHTRLRDCNSHSAYSYDLCITVRTGPHPIEGLQHTSDDQTLLILYVRTGPHPIEGLQLIRLC